MSGEPMKMLEILFLINKYNYIDGELSISKLIIMYFALHSFAQSTPRTSETTSITSCIFLCKILNTIYIFV